MFIQRLQLVVLALLPFSASAVEDYVELETTRIIANEELPGILYLVPWKDVQASKVDSQKLVLQDFFGDLYEPILPSVESPSLPTQP